MRSRSARLLPAAVLALAVLGGGLSPAGSVAFASAGAPPETNIKPASLERGANPGIPQVLGRTILDGDRRIKVAAQEVQLLGTSGEEYVVLVYPRSGSPRVLRVAADGTRETIMRDVDGDVALSRDGAQVFESVLKVPGERTVVVVRDAETGDRIARRTFRGYVRVLDADEEPRGPRPARPRPDLLVAHPHRRHATDLGEGRYFADIRADRFATMAGTGEDLCSTLATLPPKSDVLWRSCRQAVLEAAPNGRRLVTMDIYGDGPMGRLQLHGDHGRLIATYDTPGYFGRASFETNRAVLIQTYGTEKAAIVRCVVGDCERASRRIATP